MTPSSLHILPNYGFAFLHRASGQFSRELRLVGLLEAYDWSTLALSRPLVCLPLPCPSLHWRIGLVPIWKENRFAARCPEEVGVLGRKRSDIPALGSLAELAVAGWMRLMLLCCTWTDERMGEDEGLCLCAQLIDWDWWARARGRDGSVP